MTPLIHVGSTDRAGAAGRRRAVGRPFGLRIVHYSLFLTFKAVCFQFHILCLAIVFQVSTDQTVDQLLDQSHIILVNHKERIGRVDHDHALQTGHRQ